MIPAEANVRPRSLGQAEYPIAQRHVLYNSPPALWSIPLNYCHYYHYYHLHLPLLITTTSTTHRHTNQPQYHPTSLHLPQLSPQQSTAKPQCIISIDITVGWAAG